MRVASSARLAWAINSSPWGWRFRGRPVFAVVQRAGAAADPEDDVVGRRHGDGVTGRAGDGPATVSMVKSSLVKPTGTAALEAKGLNSGRHRTIRLRQPAGCAQLTSIKEL